MIGEGYQAFFAAFAHDTEAAVVHINILQSKSDEFGASHACGVEGFEDEAVAESGKAFSKIDVLEEECHAFVGDKGGESFAIFGHDDFVHWVDSYPVAFEGKLIVGLERG